MNFCFIDVGVALVCDSGTVYDWSLEMGVWQGVVVWQWILALQDLVLVGIIGQVCWPSCNGGNVRATWQGTLAGQNCTLYRGPWLSVTAGLQTLECKRWWVREGGFGVAMVVDSGPEALYGMWSLVVFVWLWVGWDMRRLHLAAFISCVLWSYMFCWSGMPFTNRIWVWLSHL